MDESRKGARRILAQGVSLVRKVWVNTVLLLVAGIMIGSGVYVRSRPEWTLRADIRAYNQGVSTYQLLLWEALFSETLPAPRLFPSETPPSPSLSSEETLPSPSLSSEEMVLSVYPLVVEKAGVHFEKAGLKSRDKKLKSLALYNLGTMFGRLALGEGRLNDMAGAITKLRQAIRDDPNNEDAKFNLELLERALGVEAKERGGPGGGYAPGAVDKGY